MAKTAEYPLSLESIRETAAIVYGAAKSGFSTNFDLHPERLDAAADLVVSIICRDYGTDLQRYRSEIPPHGRWQHFQTGGVDRMGFMLEEWRSSSSQEEVVDDLECARRCLDLFFVSVLLDAGAGDSWKYTERDTGLVVGRSEGLAVASYHMFRDGKLFSSSSSPCVDGKALEALTVEAAASGLQSSPANPLSGVENRVSLLRRLGSSLLARPEIYGAEGRPGNLVDALLNSTTAHSQQEEDDGNGKGNNNNTKTKTTPRTTTTIISIKTLWTHLQDLLLPTWPPGRTVYQGQQLGDAWPLPLLSSTSTTIPGLPSPPGIIIQPFHKLTQWLAYSLMVPMTRLLGPPSAAGVQWADGEADELLTGLPEYRNGGLFVDTGVLTLKPGVLKVGLDNTYHISSVEADGGPEVGVEAGGAEAEMARVPSFPADGDVIVEWRALTVALLDELLGLVNDKLLTMVTSAGGGLQTDHVGGGEDGGNGKKKPLITMAQMLEAGSWKAGRELAARYRPRTKGAPIVAVSDGTLF